MASKLTSYRRKALSYYNSRPAGMSDQVFCKAYRIKEEDLKSWITLAGLEIIEVVTLAKKDPPKQHTYYTSEFNFDRETMAMVEVSAGRKKKSAKDNSSFMNVDYLRMRILQMICALDRSYETSEMLSSIRRYLDENR